jgi:hypothetical protein
MRFGAIAEGSYRLTILDAAGKRIMNKEIEVVPNSTFHFNRSTNLAAGTYFISVTGKNIKQVFTIVFQ